MRTWISVSMALALAGGTVACSSRDNGGTTDTDSGTVNTGGGDDGGTINTGGGDDGGGNVTASVTTVSNAVQNSSSFKDILVEIDNAVVVAAYSYASSGGGQTGTFYIQDQSGGPGLAVFVSKTDSATFPAVGDVVTAKGRLSYFSGSLQMSSSSKYNIALSVTKTGTGTAMSGAYPPAGMPTEAANASDYAHTATNAHPEQVGTVIHIPGPLMVTDAHPTTFVNTPSSTTADAGSPKPVGFEVSNGIWVDDSNVYYDCIKSLDGGSGALNLQNGITGVWDRYQDFYAGTAQNPAPTVPVIVPFSCKDIGQ